MYKLRYIKEAIADYTKAIALKPNVTDYYINRSEAYKLMADAAVDEQVKAKWAYAAEKDTKRANELKG